MTSKFLNPLLCLSFCLILVGGKINAQGTWTPLANMSPDPNSGVMILLSDGSVLTKTSSGPDFYGNVWNKLTPDAHGSYVNGTWSTIAPMFDTRLYFSSQLLKDGRLYVAGGEYGTGAGGGELYDPIADTWAHAGWTANPIDTFYDANSEILPDGKVLQGVVNQWGYGNEIYDPVTSSYTLGAPCIGSHDESTWVKLADNSILFVDWGSRASERYIPSTGTWIADGNVPVDLYDGAIWETGPGLLLPDGRAFFLGSSGHTAYYTPTGTVSPGSWTAGPDIPMHRGAPDGVMSMMMNGKILMVASDTPSAFNNFPSPTWFYVFDYLTNTYTHIMAPTGDDTLTGSAYWSNMLNLPDGSILFASQGGQQYYTYKPTGTPLAAGKPTVDSVFKINCDTFKITGKLFNGISEGSCYGDDWQMSTNYPLVRLISGNNVYYTRTWNWNRTGVMTGALKDTALFSLPAGLPMGTYSLELVVNGNPSVAHTFKTCGLGVEESTLPLLRVLNVYPNPATDETRVSFSAHSGSYSIELTDLLGRVVLKETGTAVSGNNEYTLHLHQVPASVYTLTIRQNEDLVKTKLVVN